MKILCRSCKGVDSLEEINFRLKAIEQSFLCHYWSQVLGAIEVYTTEMYQVIPSDQKYITVVYPNYKQGFSSWSELREYVDNKRKTRKRKRK